MKFGFLHDIAGVNFDLPEDHPRTAKVLQNQGRLEGEPVRIYVGATGWGHPEWVGLWYPPKTKSTGFLRHYAQQFGTIELNTTHYRIPEVDVVERWYDSAPAGFKFCPKVPQIISHYGNLTADDATTRFVAAIVRLREKLGPCFLQLPEHLAPSSTSVLDFARKWPMELDLHWEFRHPAWFAGGPQAEHVFDTLESLGQGMVITDVAGRRDILHMQLTSPTLVLRFVGNRFHPSDFTRTEAWVERIRKWVGLGLREAFIFIHQHGDDIVPEFAMHWADLLCKSLGVPVTCPKSFANPKPPPGKQQSLF